jgi:hypothetical protein
LDEELQYTKGGFDLDNPQPKPAEIEELMEILFPEYPYEDGERAHFLDLHAKQIEHITDGSQ